MTSRKAQGLGFIIVLIISIFAIVGVVVGTINVWTALSCSLGAPLRTSFEPHAGNLKSNTIYMEYKDIGNITFEECNDTTYNELWAAAIDAGDTPDASIINEIAMDECVEICPKNQTCKYFDLNITHYVPSESSRITILLYYKIKSGNYHDTNYAILETQILENQLSGSSFPVTFTQAFIEKGDVVGNEPLLFSCDEGSFIRISGKAGEKLSQLEDPTKPNDFCFVPKIKINSSVSSGKISFEIRTNQASGCFYALPNQAPTDASSNPRFFTDDGYLHQNPGDDDGNSIDIDYVAGNYYIICRSNIGTAEVWYEP